ncbi:MAG: M20/M25/M40 family metallo-hydrolase [Oscillospiraceae bacterium]|nr:M20/M25/M40 family metallo-hydrolase [Oscillospiraceae bacterium]
MDALERYERNLGRMIRLETVSSYGQTDLSAFYAFQELIKELFPDITAACEFEDYRGSMLLRWKGRGGGAPALFMNHFDVVEPLKGWTHPPFCGEVFDGKLWGRGALDNKGGLWGMLQAADELAREGFTPESDIYFESSCNEETSSEGAKHFGALLRERGVRFSFVLDEGGMIMYEPISGAKGSFAMVGMGERGCADLLFTAKGAGGHASAPERDTALVRLGKFMAAADGSRLFKTEISPVLREMFRRLAPSVSGPLKTVYAHPELFDRLLRSVMPRASGTARALLQSTLAFTMASGSGGRNVLPEEASVVGNLRVSHHQGYQSSLAAVTKLAEKFGVETTVLEPAADSPLSDYRGGAFRLLESAVSAAFDGVVTAPYIMTGCSDARAMAELTDSCFRFVPFAIDARQLESIHGTDECVDVSTLVPAVKFYRYMMSEGGT